MWNVDGQPIRGHTIIQLPLYSQRHQQQTAAAAFHFVELVNFSTDSQG